VPLSTIVKPANKLLHPRNLHRDGYPMDELVQTFPALKSHVITQTNRDKTINFADPSAVKALNAALLAHYYNISLWDIPAGYLCPPVPGRADYVHHLADLLADSNNGDIPTGSLIRGLDIGVGANAIYPIIGSQSYGWHFVGTEIEAVSAASATYIAQANPKFKNSLKVRRQTNLADIFDGVIKPQDKFAFTMCNPPFHGSAQDAQRGSERKVNNLTRHRDKRNPAKGHSKVEKTLNFAGRNNELYCEGGEFAFITRMIEQSQRYATQVGWFTSLVSKRENLVGLYQKLKLFNAKEVKTVNMAQGQKSSRFVAWRF
jgi:23S rRNA (adenine1618-N6)-methyltransferase